MAIYKIDPVKFSETISDAIRLIRGGMQPLQEALSQMIAEQAAKNNETYIKELKAHHTFMENLEFYNRVHKEWENMPFWKKWFVNEPTEKEFGVGGFVPKPCYIMDEQYLKSTVRDFNQIIESLKQSQMIVDMSLNIDDDGDIIRFILFVNNDLQDSLNKFIEHPVRSCHNRIVSGLMFDL